MRDYTGKTVFVGIDVHKKTYSVTCISEGMIVKKDTMRACPNQLAEYLHKYFAKGEIKTVYEAGFSGFALHRFLLTMGINNIVVHAASVEIAARDRVKTDKRDSLKLATQLAAGRLRGIYVPTVQREGYREVSRMREKVAKDKRRVGHRLKSLLYRQGLISAEEEDEVSLKWIKKVSQYEVEEAVKYGIQICIEEWLFLKDKLKEIERELARQALADIEVERIYRSAPGIGPIHARVLANELETMKQFGNENQLFSFTGLTPSERSSGEQKRQGHITRQGRAVLRKTLVQAAWLAIYKDPSLMEVFERISRTAGKKRAIIGVARRLVGKLRSCFNSNSLYRYGRVRKEEIDIKTGEILQVVNG